MTLAATPHPGESEFVIEDLTTGHWASGFGRLGDGRPFSFRVHRGQLVVEIFRPRRTGPVPTPEDVMATAHRGLTDIDIDDPRSLLAAVRDTIATIEPAR